MNCAHTHFPAGKRVRVRLKDGSVFFDHFVERQSRFVVLRARGRISTAAVQSIGYARSKQ